MSLSTILTLLENVPEAIEVVEAGRAVQATPEYARFLTTLANAQAILGAKAAPTPAKAVPEPPAHVGGAPHGTDSGRI